MLKQNQVVSGLELWQWRKTAIQSAITADISPMEVDWLLLTIANLDRLALRLESFKTWPRIPIELSLTELDHLWQRRLHEHLPVQYIAGTTAWRKFQLTVSNAVLIPRPETEILIDLAVAAAQGELKAGHWADLGTGSGAIALSIA